MSMQNPEEKIVVKVDPDLEDIIPGFLKNRLGDIDKIHAALGQKDFETIRILGHTMKGTGGGYGFDMITDIGRSIEEAAKENNTQSIQRSADELTTYLGQIEIVYEE